MTSYRGFSRHIINLAVAILEILGKVNKVHVLKGIQTSWKLAGFGSTDRLSRVKNKLVFLGCQRLLQIKENSAKIYQRKGGACGSQILKEKMSQFLSGK